MCVCVRGVRLRRERETHTHTERERGENFADDMFRYFSTLSVQCHMGSIYTLQRAALFYIIDARMESLPLDCVCVVLAFLHVAEVCIFAPCSSDTCARVKHSLRLPRWV